MASKVIPITYELRNIHGYPMQEKLGMFRSYRDLARFIWFTLAFGAVLGGIVTLIVVGLVNLWN